MSTTGRIVGPARVVAHAATRATRGVQYPAAVPPLRAAEVLFDCAALAGWCGVPTRLVRLLPCVALSDSRAGAGAVFRGRTAYMALAGRRRALARPRGLLELSEKIKEWYPDVAKTKTCGVCSTLSMRVRSNPNRT